MLRTAIRTISAVTALACMLAVAPSAMAAFESGRTKTDPWNGYWWPKSTDKTNLYDDGGPLDKYDQFIENKYNQPWSAQAWERYYDSVSPTSSAASWAGHCQAWASAAILQKQPPSSVTREGVTFTEDDLEGLLSELYKVPTYKWLRGVRNRDNNTASASYKDIEPAWLDYIVRYYIGYRREAIVMDTNADAQVWNFPAFAYRRWTTAKADGSTDIVLEVWYQGTSLRNSSGPWRRTYRYNVKPGTLGTYTGNSVDDHPDYAYLPTGHTAVGQSSKRNPWLYESVLEQIFGYEL